MAKTANLYARIEPDVKEEAEQLNIELEKGYTDMLEGRTENLKDVFDNIRKDYEL